MGPVAYAGEKVFECFLFIKEVVINLATNAVKGRQKGDFR
jgi:hypothetical protein